MSHTVTDTEARALQWMHDAIDIRSALETPNECHEGVTRRGEFEPCDKPAVALRIDPNEGCAYPVCGRHSRADMISLAEVAAALLRTERPASARTRETGENDE